jgi:hypothetical protein
MRTATCALGLLIGWLTGGAAFAGELIIAADKQCDYQIVRPNQTPDAIIDRAIADAADIMREMFQANGFTVPVVQESQADKQKPGLYLGDTAAARAAGVDTTALPAWTYVWKTAGKNVIIAGRDGVAASREKRQDRPSSLGTVKGVTDFLRQFCGTRFLTPGGLTGIEFLPAPRIAVPENLAVRKEPLVNYNCGERPTTDVATIALNFLTNVTTEYGGHTHEIAVPADEYADQHPEYFALVNGQRIREHEHPWKKGVMVKEPHLCYSNKEVQELIYRDMLRSIDAGYPEYLSLQADGFTPCECAACRKMFDTADWGEKLWLLNRQWAKRLLEDRPKAFLIVGSYTVTEKPPASFKEFPPNVRINSRSTLEALAQWNEHKIPGGFTTYLHAWGGYHLCGCLPVRTPRYAEQVARLYDTYRVKGVGLDSPPANMWGLEGPTVYVYSRMFDDVKTNSAQQLVEEYVQAAYGPAAGAMKSFFGELHHTLEVYADVFGVDNGSFQKYTRTDGRSVRYLTWQTKLRLIGFLYPPETLSLLESHLAQAEKTAGLTDKIKLRLALARREFNYLNSTARVVHVYHAYLTRLDKSSLDQLLTEMEAREKMILSWYDTAKAYRPGVYLQRPIAPQWRMYVGGPGHYNTHLLANGGSYLSEPVPPFTWNIGEMRKAPLLAARTITARKTATPLSLGAAQWQQIPAEKLGPLSLGAAAPRAASAVQVAYDNRALYVRFTGQLLAGWNRPPAMQHDHREIVTRESFGLVLAPDSNPARYYRFAGGVDPAARYDARQGFVEDAIDPRFNQEDVTWNPEWRYECAVAADGKSWSALMVIPFRSLGTPGPTAGAEWKVNVGRVHQASRTQPREESLWSANPGTAAIGDRKAFGTLRFE